MAEESNTPYRVLARKYRPQHFDDLIGQETLVRTLRNAIAGGRIAHAFMLTGIRGVGKTTTARIIAKALNYTGPDGKAGPTAGPTDDCPVCRAIAEDRHPDVLEMDAASRTGVNDIREILDGVRYAPSSARYKIYIIDEVHMLSQSAFNALLKTLEEPPPHVKFIFATTEIRKVPVTVLSRCQQFDLRRVDHQVLAGHYRNICAKENVEIEEEALALIARAAEGSVRDGLSLLDQAIALTGGKISAAQIGDMLGLAGRGRVLELLEHLLSGHTEPALKTMEELHKLGADPAAVVQDLLECVHILSRIKATPAARGGATAAGAMDAAAREKCEALAAGLPMPSLGRAWQILLKGLGEIAASPDPQAAAEMLAIRLAYAADLPDPADLVRRLKDEAASAPAHAAPPAGGSAPSSGISAVSSPRRGSAGAAPMPAGAAETMVAQSAAAGAPQSIGDVVALLQNAGELLLAGEVFHFAHPVKIAPGRLELRLEEGAPPTLASNLGKALSAACGSRWIVSLAGSGGEPTLAQREKTLENAALKEVRNIPLVKEIMTLFPGAEIVKLYGQQED